MAMAQSRLENLSVSPRVARKRAARLSEIIVAATRLFNRRGFLATTMEEIATAMDLIQRLTTHIHDHAEENNRRLQALES